MTAIEFVCCYGLQGYNNVIIETKDMAQCSTILLLKNMAFLMAKIVRKLANYYPLVFSSSHCQVTELHAFLIKLL